MAIIIRSTQKLSSQKYSFLLGISSYIIVISLVCCLSACASKDDINDAAVSNDPEHSISDMNKYYNDAKVSYVLIQEAIKKGNEEEAKLQLTKLELAKNNIQEEWNHIDKSRIDTKTRVNIENKINDFNLMYNTLTHSNTHLSTSALAGNGRDSGQALAVEQNRHSGAGLTPTASGPTEQHQNPEPDLHLPQMTHVGTGAAPKVIAPIDQPQVIEPDLALPQMTHIR